MNKNALLRFFLVLLLAFITIFTISSCRGPEEEHPQADLVRRSIAAGETDLDIAMYAINEIVGSSMGENYTLQFDEELNAIVLFTWFPGLAHDIKLAQGSNELARTTWLSSANSVASAGANFHGLAEDVGADVDVIVHIFCDVDPDIIYLTVKNGVILYNVVQ